MDQDNIYGNPSPDGRYDVPETELLAETQAPQYQPPVYNQPQQPQHQPPVYNQPQQPPQYQPPVYNQPQPQYQPPVYGQPQQPIGNPVLDSGPLLTFGILAVAFCSTFWVSFLGIVFGCIQKNKLEAFLAAGGVYAGKAKVGSILAKVGRIVGIVMTACLAVYLTCLMFIAMFA